MGRKQKRQEERYRIKVIIRRVIILIILFVLIYVGVGIYRESKIRLEKGEVEQKLEVNEQTENNTIERVSVNIPTKYLNYEVSAKLEMPTIKFGAYILENYAKKEMEVCPCKYWGPEPNEIGNYCIGGHNYNKKNMFNHLIDLKLGDEIYLLDNKNGKYVYTIYDIYKVKPNNIEPLSQDTNGKREITLITCVNYSANRLIIKAVEK